MAAQAPGKEVVLKVDGLTTDKIKNVSFELRKGEILGLGGLVGAGRTETAVPFSVQTAFTAAPSQSRASR